MHEPHSPYIEGAVPIPNRLFDDVLPTLSDTELRVLLIVWRQTWGFREGSDLGGWRFKPRDWISQKQLMQKTGRGSEAVAKAIHGLVSASLIVVEDSEGRPLDTPAKRRRHLGRLYFRPVDNPPELWIIRRSCHPVKPNTTTYTLYNIKRKTNRPLRKLPDTTRRSGWQRAVAASDTARPTTTSLETLHP